MELKFRDFMIAMMVLCSNRTFMELKFKEDENLWNINNNVLSPL